MRKVWPWWLLGVALGCVALAAMFCGACASAPRPVPAPIPTPTPVPPPVPGFSCASLLDKDHFVDLSIGHIGTNLQLFTATPKFCGLPLRSDYFPVCGSKCCTLGVDGKSAAAIQCEAEWSGPPSWQAVNLKLVTPLNGNPYNCKVAEIVPPATVGSIKACGLSGCSNIIVYP